MDIRSMLRTAGMSDEEIEVAVKNDRLSTETVMALNKMRRTPMDTSLVAPMCTAWNSYAEAKGSPVRLSYSLDGTQGEGTAPATPTHPAGRLTKTGGK